MPEQTSTIIKDWLERGVALQQAGRLEEAVACYEKVLATKSILADAHNNLGVALKAGGKLKAAVDQYRQSLAIKPDNASTHNNMGNALVALGQLKEAAQHFRKALEIKPDYAEAWNNFGNALSAQGKHEAASKQYQKAIQLKPDYLEALNNMGVSQQKCGQLQDAVKYYRQTIKLKADHPDAHNNLGSALRELGQYAEAVSEYREALKINPVAASTCSNLGYVLRKMGRQQESLQAYEQALSLNPELVEARWAHTMAQLPLYYASQSEVDHCRAVYGESLAALQAWCEEKPERFSRLWSAVGVSLPFYLAYQGLNDRSLQSQYGGLACHVMQDWYQHQEFVTSENKSEPADGRIRVGFLSAHIRRHSVWDVLSRGFINHLDRSRFSVYCYHTGWKKDQITKEAEQLADHFTQGPHSLQSWVQIIRDHQLDVLVYPEIGMDPMTVKLAALRLAPVQMASWGHPVTSGLPTMDYFLSGELLEQSDAQEHYSESLIKLPNLGCYYAPMEDELSEIDLAGLGISDHPEVIKFVSCQQSIKYLPRYDDVFPRIAQNVKQCQFIFFELGQYHEIYSSFKQRLSKAFQSAGLDMEDYCVFLKAMSRKDFLGFLHKVDIYLDTIAFSGFTTAIQALGCNGLPIVTLEGELMRQKLAAAILRRIGVTDTIAADVDQYVAIATKLALEKPYREKIHQTVSANIEQAYADRSVIQAFEECLVQSVEAGQGEDIKAVADGRSFLLDFLPKNSVGVEIGVHLGDFSSRILSVVKPKKLHLIDPWKYEKSSIYKKAWYGGAAKKGQQELDARYELVLQRFQTEIQSGQVEVHRGSSEEMGRKLADESLDWVYIDGNHLYKYVKKDLAIFFDKVVKGGLITGDDYTKGGWWKGGVMKAVDEFVSYGKVELIEIRNAQYIIRKI